MKNKRGFLLAEETLKIVIALIGISFLIYLLVSLYMTNKTSKKLELAKATLEHLVEEIDSGASEVEIYNPEGWVVSSWSFEKILPRACSNVGWENCLCICESPWVDTGGNFLDNCDDTSKSVCSDNSKKMIVVVGVNQQPIHIRDPPLILKIGDGKITV